MNNECTYVCTNIYLICYYPDVLYIPLRDSWTYNVTIQYYFLSPIQVLTEPLVDLSSFTTEAVQAFLEYLYTAKCCVPINEHIKMELSTLAEM